VKIIIILVAAVITFQWWLLHCWHAASDKLRGDLACFAFRRAIAGIGTISTLLVLRL
jgi:hypothetical protein